LALAFLVALPLLVPLRRYDLRTAKAAAAH
jgi:hypothetical protein